MTTNGSALIQPPPRPMPAVKPGPARKSVSIPAMVVAAAMLGAEVPGATAGDRVLRLDQLTVVASPVIEGNRVTRYGGQITTISAEQIVDLCAQDLTSALRRTPGVTISRYNPVGSFGGAEGGGVFLRGMGSSRPGGEIVTLFDGLPLSNPVWNHPLIDLTTIDPVAAIQVRKGAHPAAFGNAFGSVNLVPKRIGDSGTHTELLSSYGTFDTLVERFTHGARVGAFDYLLSQGYRSSRGHRPDASGETQDQYLRLGFAPAPDLDLSVFGLHTRSYAYDPGPEGNPNGKQGKYETENVLTGIKLAHDADPIRGSWQVYYGRGDGDWFDQAGPGADDTLNDWDVYGLRLRETVQPWNGGELLAGLDLDYEDGRARLSTDAGAVTHFRGKRFTLLAPYAGISQQIDGPGDLRVTPSLAVRHYTHSDFDAAWSPQAGLVIARNRTEWHALYAHGIRYPGLNVVVFSESVLATLGKTWEQLDPETVDHYEIGVRHRFNDRIEAEFTCFSDSGRNRYVFWRPGGGGPPNVWENIERFRTDGFEATFSCDVTETLRLFTGITHLRVGDPDDLPYAPEWTLVGGLNWRFLEYFRLSVDVQHVGQMQTLSQARATAARNNGSVGAYVLANGRLSYDFLRREDGTNGQVFLSLENITDENYEYSEGWPMPGITASIGARIML